MKCPLKVTAFLIFMLGASALVQSAPAATVTDTFTGHIAYLRVGPDSFGNPANNSDGPAIGGTFAGLQTGDSVSFSFSYDPSAPPIAISAPGEYTYGLLSWSVTALGKTVSGGSDGLNTTIGVYNDANPSFNGVEDAFLVGIQSGYWANVEFQDYSATALNSTAIPTTFDRSAWAPLGPYPYNYDGSFQLPGSVLPGSEQNAETPYAFFIVDAFYSSVPEPGTSALLVLGLLIFQRARQKSRLL